MSARQLDDIARSGKPIASIGWGSDVHGHTVAHGYDLRWVNTQGMGNHGTAYLVGTTAHTKHLVWRGKVQSLVDLGFTQAQAERLLGLNVRYVHELAALVADVKDDPAMQFAAKSFIENRPPSCRRWLQEWANQLDDRVVLLTIPRFESLALMVNEVSKT